MDRRVTLQKHRDIPEAAPGSNSITNSSTTNSTVNNTVLTPSLTNVGSVSVASSIDNIGTVPSNVNCSATPVISRKRKREDTGSVCSAGSKRTNRSASWNSVKDVKEEQSSVTSGKLNGRTSKKEGPRRRRRKKQIIKNGTLFCIFINLVAA